MALIGPNWRAGKTTSPFQLRNRNLPAQRRPGRWLYDGDGDKALLNGREAPCHITRLGTGLAPFQNIRLFNEMTVLENVMVGRHCRTHAGIWRARRRDRATMEEEQQSVDLCYALL